MKAKGRELMGISFAPAFLALAFLFVLQCYSYFARPDTLQSVEFPLISLSSISASEGYVIFAQKYYNRVQIYDREAKFVSGFSLRGSSSSFQVVAMKDKKFIDCTPRGAKRNSFDVYSLEGQRSELTLSEGSSSACESFESKMFLSSEEIASVTRNFLGYKLHIRSSSGDKEFTSSQKAIPYLIMNFLYIPVAFF